MNKAQLETYCRRLHLLEDCVVYLRSMMNSDPARRVRSGMGNVTVRYPSRKESLGVAQLNSRGSPRD